MMVSVLCFVVCILGVNKLPRGVAVVLLCFHLNTSDDGDVEKFEELITCIH